jgi:hypothetical protein
VLLTHAGLTRYFVLFVADLKSRRAKIAGIIHQLDGRWMRQVARNLTDKEECLSQIIPLGERHLRRALTEYTEHDHLERNHQGLGNGLIEPLEETGQGRVVCREQLAACSGTPIEGPREAS